MKKGILILSEEQVNECAKIVMKEKDKSFDQIYLEKGYLTIEQIEWVHKYSTSEEFKKQEQEEEDSEKRELPYLTQAFLRFQNALKEYDSRTLEELIAIKVKSYFFTPTPLHWFETWFEEYPTIRNFILNTVSQKIIVWQAYDEWHGDVSLSQRENIDACLSGKISIVFNKEEDFWKLHGIILFPIILSPIHILDYKLTWPPLRYLMRCRTKKNFREE